MINGRTQPRTKAQILLRLRLCIRRWRRKKRSPPPPTKACACRCLDTGSAQTGYMSQLLCKARSSRCGESRENRTYATGASLLLGGTVCRSRLKELFWQLLILPLRCNSSSGLISLCDCASLQVTMMKRSGQ
jgi:hypothetical protein